MCPGADSILSILTSKGTLNLNFTANEYKNIEENKITTAKPKGFVTFYLPFILGAASNSTRGSYQNEGSKPQI